MDGANAVDVLDISDEDQRIKIGDKEYRVIIEDAMPQVIAEDNNPDTQETAYLPKRLHLQSIETGHTMWITDPHIIDAIERRIADVRL